MDSKLAYSIFLTFIVGSLLLSKVFDKQFVTIGFKQLAYLVLSSIWPLLLLDFAVSGVWWDFNPAYVLPFSVYSLPLEEICFFFVVQSAIALLFVNAKSRLKLEQKTYARAPQIFVALSIFFAGVVLLSLFQQWWYTALILLYLAVNALRARKQLLFHTPLFAAMVGVVLLLTLVFNMILTALPVVLYNSSVKSGAMIGTIPVEDFFFALVMLSNLFFSWIRYEQKR